jgi:opacity protein-like surface antigen
MLLFNQKLQKLLLTGLIFFLIVANSYAQVTINSPYSRFGVGELATSRNTYNFSMGGIAYAISNSQYINPYNPASNAAFDSMSFLFSGGMVTKFGTHKTETMSSKTNFASLGYLLFGFPVTKWMKSSIGLIPYSNVGYNIVAHQVVENVGSTDFYFKGLGGLNEFYFNSSFRLHKNLAIGAKASYLFGKSNNSRLVFFPDSIGRLNTKIDSYIEVGNMYFDFGAQYKKQIAKGMTLGLGAIYAPSQNMNATLNYIARSYFGTSLGIESFRDTIAMELDKPGAITIPEKYGFGVMLKKNEYWMIGADYGWQNWSKYKAFGLLDSLKNSMQFSVGGEFMPSEKVYTKYWKRVKYRLGFRYNKTYLNLNNTPLNEFGITFGLGLPVPRSLSTINLGLEWGKKGTTSNNLIQDNYLKFTLDISIWERWFVKRPLF